MNSYELSRAFIDFAFDNPEKIKPNHYAVYFFAVEHCNRLGWKEKFGLPSQMVMEAIGIKNWRTYSTTLNELIEWGFIKMIETSKNQYSSNIVAIVNFTKAPTKALDKALSKHLQKQGTKQGQSIVSIDKQLNKEQETKNKQLIKDVCDFFNVNELKNFNAFRAINAFVNVSGIDSKTFEAYKEYKQTSEEKIHGWQSFIGSQERSFSDGAWASCDWSAKIKYVPKPKNGIPLKPDNTWINTHGKDMQLYQQACKAWRDNGYENVQPQGSTRRIWRKKAS